MIALDNLIETRQETAADVLRLAEDALRRYGLDGARVQSQQTSGEQMLRIDVREDGTEYHPYLGNVAGLRFMLKLRRSDVEGLAASEQEIRTLAELARDTDLPVPEPVPACDGDLIPSICAEGLGRFHSILYRWI